LLPLLTILHRDPQAALLVLPSDHYVSNESLLAASLKHAMTEIAHQPERIVLLGLTPEHADPELGYIVPAGTARRNVRDVSQFVEKPSATSARRLIERGGLWNSFIFAAHGQTLLRAFEERCPDIVATMRDILHVPDGRATRLSRLAGLYEQLPLLDFSRDVVQSSASRLRVLAVPQCGWSDLGTPQRVAATLTRERLHWPMRSPSAWHARGYLDLARISHRAVCREWQADECSGDLT
jgi:mannose-1-phosphate guanylyltransferase